MKRYGFLIVLLSLLAAARLNAAQFLFTPELILSEEYSDNIFLTPHDKKDDFISTAGVNLGAQLIGRTAGLELNYNPSYSSFADNSDLDFWRHAGRARFWGDLARATRLELTNDYLETESPRDRANAYQVDGATVDPLIDQDLTRRGRTRFRHNVAQGSLRHQFGADDSILLGALYGLREDIDTIPGLPVDDYTELRPFLEMAYWFTPFWGLELDGYYSNRDYEDRNDRKEYTGTVRLLHRFTRNLSGYVEYHHTYLDFDQETDNDYHVHAPAVGFRYQFQENAFIRAGAGYYLQEVKNRDDDKDGVFAFSEINKRWDFRSSYISATGGSGYEIADSGTDDLGLALYYRGRLELGYRFTQQLTTSVFGSYRHTDYINQEPGRIDKVLDTGAEIAYQLLQWMNIGLTYNYRDFRSDVAAEEYSENSVMLTIRLAPVTPLRWN